MVNIDEIISGYNYAKNMPSLWQGLSEAELEQLAAIYLGFGTARSTGIAKAVHEVLAEKRKRILPSGDTGDCRQQLIRCLEDHLSQLICQQAAERRRPEPSMVVILQCQNGINAIRTMIYLAQNAVAVTKITV